MEKITIEEGRKIELPKWPQMIVAGNDVEVEQALEIIRRTDSFFHCSIQMDGVEREMARVVKMKSFDDFRDEKGEADFHAFDSWRQGWVEKWRLIQLQYLMTDWIASHYICGPHGWVHPHGPVMYWDNIGKWPKVEEVFDEWVLIAKAFPFLDLRATLMSGEMCEEKIEPLVTFVVEGGKVYLVTDHDPLDREAYKIADKARGYPIGIGGFRYPFGIHLLQKWADDTFGKEDKGREDG